MNVIGTSKWDLGNIPIPQEQGVSPLTLFASTRIPQIDAPSGITTLDGLKSALQKATTSVRRIDSCPRIGTDQSGELNIIPFKEIPQFVQAGDVISFVKTDTSGDWQGANVVAMLEQRGWHAEIISPKQGSLVLHGQWHGPEVITPVGDVRSHPDYPACSGIWNLHIFRFSPPKREDGPRFSSLMQGVEAWGSVFPQSTWPESENFNPVLFSDLPGLAKLGDSLIKKVTPPPTMVCIEWVHAVFCLACCYPLTKKFLNGRGMLSAFLTNFPNIPLLDDSLEPFDTLPWAPYQPSYLVRSFLDTYFDEDLSEGVIQSLPIVAGLPSPLIMPIAPLLEMRRKSNPSNFDISYVCTAVADEWCVLK